VLPGHRKNDKEEPNHSESLVDHFQKRPAYGAQRLKNHRGKGDSHSRKDAQSATSSLKKMKKRSRRVSARVS